MYLFNSVNDSVLSSPRLNNYHDSGFNWMSSQPSNTDCSFSSVYIYGYLYSSKAFECIL